MIKLIKSLFGAKPEKKKEIEGVKITDATARTVGAVFRLGGKEHVMTITPAKQGDALQTLVSPYVEPEIAQEVLMKINLSRVAAMVEVAEEIEELQVNQKKLENELFRRQLGTSRTGTDPKPILEEISNTKIEIGRKQRTLKNFLKHGQ